MLLRIRAASCLVLVIESTSSVADDVFVFPHAGSWSVNIEAAMAIRYSMLIFPHASSWFMVIVTAPTIGNYVALFPILLLFNVWLIGKG